MVMGSASGYPNYSGSYIQPHISDRVIERFYCSSVLTDITNGDFLGELRRCGDTIQFKRKPRAVIHPYIKNLKLVHDFMEPDCVAIQAAKGLYFSMKLDDVDKHQICNSRQLIDWYTEDANHQFQLAMELDALTEMICNVDQLNQGCCAGAQSRCYNLGDIGKPKCINCDNILDWFCDVFTVLAEACVVSFGMGHQSHPRNSSEPFIVLPYRGYNTLKKALSKGPGCCPTDPSNPMVAGKVPQMIGEFHIYVAHNLPYYIENDEQIYQIPAGRRDATAFTTTIEYLREIEHPDYHGCLFQGLIVWACGVLYPQALALSRVKFEKEAA